MRAVHSLSAAEFISSSNQLVREHAGLSPANDQFEQILTSSFDLHEAVRRATAGKGYAPAPNACATCGHEVTGRDSVVLECDELGVIVAVHHAVCR